MSWRSLIGRAIRGALGERVYLRLSATRRPAQAFLSRVRGVIHVGANQGQERALYSAFDLPVIWVEPIPEVFETLERNIDQFPAQRALNCLVSDEDGKEYQFHISNNNGESSSILNFSKHAELWPEVEWTRTVTLTSTTLPSLLHREHVDLEDFDALILDTQGSEHKILSGAADILPRFKFIKVEAADFESYEGCCRIGDLSAFLATFNFREQRRVAFKHTPGVGTYFDVVYERD